MLKFVNKSPSPKINGSPVHHQKRMSISNTGSLGKTFYIDLNQNYDEVSLDSFMLLNKFCDINNHFLSS